MLYTRICSGKTEVKKKELPVCQNRQPTQPNCEPFRRIYEVPKLPSTFECQLTQDGYAQPSAIAERLGGSNESTSLRDHIQKPLNSISVF